MTLTTDQAAGLLAAVNGKIDVANFALLKQLIETCTQPANIPDGETYEDIRNHSHRLLKQYQMMGRGVIANDPNQETLVVFMEPAKVRRLMASVPANGYIAAFPGIHSKSAGDDRVTVSLLAADSNRNIIADHISGAVTGEESWDNCDVMANIDAMFPMH